MAKHDVSEVNERLDDAIVDHLSTCSGATLNDLIDALFGVVKTGDTFMGLHRRIKRRLRYLSGFGFVWCDRWHITGEYYWHTPEPGR